MGRGMGFGPDGAFRSVMPALPLTESVRRAPDRERHLASSPAEPRRQTP